MLEWWNGGVVEWWSGGMVEWWNGGVWNGGVVEWWSGGMVECLPSRIDLVFFFNEETGNSVSFRSVYS